MATTVASPPPVVAVPPHEQHLADGPAAAAAVAPPPEKRARALMVVVTEGRNFVSMGLRPEVLRSMRYYCQIVIEDAKTGEVLLNMRTNRVLRENEQVNVAWHDTVYFEFPPGKRKKDLELKVMCYEHSPLHDHFQGEVVLPLGHLRRHRMLDQWYALARRDKRPVRGEVRLQLQLGVEIPENYVRPSNLLDAGDSSPTYKTSVSGLDLASYRIDEKRGLGLSSPEKAFKKSIKGFRSKIKKTTLGVRGYFSEADDMLSDAQSIGGSYPGGTVTDDESRLRSRMAIEPLRNQHFFNETSSSIPSGDGLNQLGGYRAESMADGTATTPTRKKAKNSSLRRKKHKKADGYDSNESTGRDQISECDEAVPAGWCNIQGASSPHHVATDESGDVLGTITPATIMEELEEELTSEGHFSEDDRSFSSTSGEALRPLISVTCASPQASMERHAIVSFDDGEDNSNQVDAPGVTLQSPFKKTIKRALVPDTATQSPTMVTGGLHPEGQIGKRSLKGSGDGSSKSHRRRLKENYGGSQRLALLNRYPNYDTKSKAAIIDQRQRAYNVWLNAYHHEVDEFFEDTRNWKVPIEMQDSKKIDYATINREWKRPWRKDMKRARDTKNNLQEVINDEMEGMEDIISKISNRARSYFEQQTSLFPASAVSAIQTMEQEARRRRERERRKARRSVSPSASPAQQRKIGPLVPTPSIPLETTGYRPMLVLVVTLLILYILHLL